MLQVPLPRPGVSINSSQPVAEVLWPMLVVQVGIAVWCNSGLYLIGHKGKSTWRGDFTLTKAHKTGTCSVPHVDLFHRETIFIQGAQSY